MLAIFQKINRFLARDKTEQRKSIRNNLQRWYGNFHFKLKRRYTAPTYVSYHPDSSYIAQLHPEFNELIEKWLYENRVNNGGDIGRLYSLMLNIKQVLNDRVSGNFAELGVWRGNSAAVLAHYAAKAGREVFLFDTFQGFDARDLEAIDAQKIKTFADTSVALVKKNVGHDPIVKYIVGYFPESLTEEAKVSTYAFVHIDCDLYKPMRDALEFFYPRISPGGMLFMHDYSSGYWEGAKKAIDEFCVKTSESVILLPDKSGTAVIRKSKVRITQ